LVVRGGVAAYDVVGGADRADYAEPDALPSRRVVGAPPVITQPRTTLPWEFQLLFFPSKTMALPRATATFTRSTRTLLPYADHALVITVAGASGSERAGPPR